MKDLTLQILIAVFEEIFGSWLFWSMVVLAVLIAGLFIYILIRDRGPGARRLLWAELWAPVGALAAILFVQFITSSGFGDIGGAIDVIVLILIGIGGAIGAFTLAYVVQSILLPRRGTD